MAKRKIQITTDNVEFLKLHKQLKSKLKTQALEEALFLAVKNEEFRKKYFDDFGEINVEQKNTNINEPQETKNNNSNKISKEWG